MPQDILEASNQRVSAKVINPSFRNDNCSYKWLFNKEDPLLMLPRSSTSAISLPAGSSPTSSFNTNCRADPTKQNNQLNCAPLLPNL